MESKTYKTEKKKDQEERMSGYKEEAPSYQHGARIVTADELYNNQITEIPMLWGYLLPKSGISLLAGDSDTGKSTFIRQLCSAIVNFQDSFLTFELNTEHKSVIYVSTEDDRSSLSALFKKENQIDTAIKGFKNFRFLFEYNEEELTNILCEELSKQPADCVVIDALGDVITTDPNNIVNVRKFYAGYKRISIKYDCLVLFVHHTRKIFSANNPSKTDVSGSQALEAKPRAVLMLSNVKGEPNSKVLNLVKGNYVPEKVKYYPIYLETEESGIFRLVDDVHTEIIKNSVKACFKDDKADEILKKMGRLQNEGNSYRKIADIMKESGVKISSSTVQRKLNR